MDHLGRAARICADYWNASARMTALARIGHRMNSSIGGTSSVRAGVASRETSASGD